MKDQEPPIKTASFQNISESEGKYVGTIVLKKNAFSDRQEVYYRQTIKAGIAIALKFNINDGEVGVFIGKSFKENHIANETFRYDVKNIEREKEYRLEIEFGKWLIDTLKINNEEITNVLDKNLTHWDLFQFYTKAMKSANYIEAISIAYILIEVELKILLRQKGVGEKIIQDQKYLYDVSKCCLKEKIINNALHKRICDFNKTRKDTIHGILDKSVKLREVKDKCEKASRIMGDVQGQWLSFKVGNQENIG